MKEWKSQTDQQHLGAAKAERAKAAEDEDEAWKWELPGKSQYQREGKSITKDIAQDGERRGKAPWPLPFSPIFQELPLAKQKLHQARGKEPENGIPEIADKSRGEAGDGRDSKQEHNPCL